MISRHFFFGFWAWLRRYVEIRRSNPLLASQADEGLVTASATHVDMERSERPEAKVERSTRDRHVEPPLGYRGSDSDQNKQTLGWFVYRLMHRRPKLEISTPSDWSDVRQLRRRSLCYIVIIGLIQQAGSSSKLSPVSLMLGTPQK